MFQAILDLDMCFFIYCYYSLLLLLLFKAHESTMQSMRILFFLPIRVCIYIYIYIDLRRSNERNFMKKYKTKLNKL